MSETVRFFGRGLALRAIAFVRLLDAAEFRIGVLPCVVHPHSRTERHLWMSRTDK